MQLNSWTSKKFKYKIIMN